MQGDMQGDANKGAQVNMTALGHEWIAAWNARDLDRVLALYAEDFEMTSEHIVRLGFDASGTLRGKSKVREYWAFALARLPDLHFELIDLYASPDSVIVFYRNERGGKIGEYLRCDVAGRIRQGSANHLVG
jgi:ketosteroid isomerase-like protein